MGRRAARCAVSSSEARTTLGVAPSGPLDAALIKRAFRAKLRRMHPDVSSSPTAGEETVQLVAAYDLLLASADTSAGAASDAADPFDEPEGEATCVFVNELRCVGRRCFSSCVAAAPSAFAWAEDTGAARCVAQGVASEYDLRRAVGQCPVECIAYVTPRQLALLEAILKSGRERRDDLNVVGERLTVLLATAKFENGRYRGPRTRTPRATDNYVDWY